MENFSGFASVRVVPIDPMTMVLPKSGMIVGENRHIRDVVENTLIWDGKKIALQGAIGETLTFQLVVFRENEDSLDDFFIRLNIPGVKKLDMYRSWSIWDTPEVAVPLSREGNLFIAQARLPYEPKTYVVHSCWVELTIPRTALSGQIAGNIVISSKTKFERGNFPVEIKVHPFAMPLRPNLIVEMNSYGDYSRLLNRTPETYLSLQRLFRKFRCTFVQVPYLQNGSIKNSFLAPVINYGSAGNSLLDWEQFDKILSGLFTGEAFSDGVPVSHFILPMNYQWPVPFLIYETDPKRYRQINIEVRKKINHHLREKGWNRTIFQEFHNENPSHGAKLPWRLDEPSKPAHIGGHRLFTGLYAEANSGLPKKKNCAYRIDISQWQEIEDSIKQIATTVSDWFVSWDPKYLTEQSSKIFRKLADTNHGIFMAYGEMMGFNTITQPNNWSLFDQYALLCWNFDLDGFEQWQVDRWQYKTLDFHFSPKEVPLFYSNAAGARDLIWPGMLFGIDGALPSLRLIGIRESLNLFDYAYLALEAFPEKKEKINELINTLVMKTAVSHYRIKDLLAKEIWAINKK